LHLIHSRFNNPEERKYGSCFSVSLFSAVHLYIKISKKILVLDSK